jgi:hypothetical protein
MGDNIETAYWLYNRTGDKKLLELAARMHANMADWVSSMPDWHNVNIAQGFREPGVYFLQAKEARLLQAAEKRYEEVIGQYGQFPGGTSWAMKIAALVIRSAPRLRDPAWWN